MYLVRCPTAVGQWQRELLSSWGTRSEALFPFLKLRTREPQNLGGDFSPEYGVLAWAS